MTRRLVVLAAATAAGLAGCQADPAAGWPDRPGPKVAVSFAPIASLAMSVVGDAGTVRPLMTSQGPHHFDIKRADAGVLRKADVFFLNGLGLDTTVANKLAAAGGSRSLRVVELAGRLPKSDLVESGGPDDHDHAGHDHAGHSHGRGPDPHVWLGLDQAAAFVAGVRDEVKLLDPAHAADYDRRAADTTIALAAVKADGLALLRPKTNRAFVSFHESLGYFAKTFDLEVAAVIEHNPGQEPTPAELRELAAVCLKRQIQVIAVEPQYTASTAAAWLKAELTRRGLPDVALVEIDPMETADPAELKAGWYEAKMRANLAALAAGLK